MDQETFRQWIYDNYNVPGDNCTLAPSMLDGILEHAAAMTRDERLAFFKLVFPDLPDCILEQAAAGMSSDGTSVPSDLYAELLKAGVPEEEIGRRGDDLHVLSTDKSERVIAEYIEKACIDPRAVAIVDHPGRTGTWKSVPGACAPDADCGG